MATPPTRMPSDAEEVAPPTSPRRTRTARPRAHARATHRPTPTLSAVVALNAPGSWSQMSLAKGGGGRRARRTRGGGGVGGGVGEEELRGHGDPRASSHARGVQEDRQDVPRERARRGVLERGPPEPVSRGGVRAGRAEESPHRRVAAVLGRPHERGAAVGVALVHVLRGEEAVDRGDVAPTRRAVQLGARAGGSRTEHVRGGGGGRRRRTPTPSASSIATVRAPRPTAGVRARSAARPRAEIPTPRACERPATCRPRAGARRDARRARE